MKKLTIILMVSLFSIGFFNPIYAALSNTNKKQEFTIQFYQDKNATQAGGEKSLAIDWPF